MQISPSCSPHFDTLTACREALIRDNKSCCDAKRQAPLLAMEGATSTDWKVVAVSLDIFLLLSKAGEKIPSPYCDLITPDGINPKKIDELKGNLEKKDSDIPLCMAAASMVDKWQAFSLWASLVTKGHGKEEALIFLQSSFHTDYYAESKGAFELWKTFIDTGQEIDRLIAIAIETQKSKEYFVRSTGLKALRHLVENGIGYDSALNIALKASEDTDREVRMYSGELWVSLVQKGQFMEEALAAAQKASQDEGWGVVIRSLYIIDELLKRGYGYDIGLEIIQDFLKGAKPLIKEFAILSLAALVERSCAMKFALSEAIRLRSETLSLVQKYVIGSLWVALVSKNQGLEEAEKALDDYLNPTKIIHEVNALKLCIALVKKGKGLKLAEGLIRDYYFDDKAQDLNEELKRLMAKNGYEKE